LPRNTYIMYKPMNYMLHQAQKARFFIV
jgi:hypothetical protein